MSIQELQKYTYYAKYARYNKEAKRRETWEEAVERVKQMHLRRYPQAREEIEYAFGFVREQKVLGSQRALQFGGPPIEQKHARIYNCISSYCDRLRFFQEAFWLLLCGCGTGFSVQKHHIAKLPPFSRSSRSGLPTKTYVVPDTIEGWADALGVLLSSYFESPVFPEYACCHVKFDYSSIRPAGSPLSSAAGKAPGPKPLARALSRIRALLDRQIELDFDRLRPIDAYDIVMHASDAVLSGGVRRSATICVFSTGDHEMLAAKTGNWLRDNPQRARSNNSVMLLRDQTTREQFREIMKSVREFGEPGFVFSDSTEFIVNPCVEIGMYPVDVETGLTGWQACNLSEINGKLVRSRQDFLFAAIAASIIGTLQAGYADFEYLGPVSERIIRREALLGVSITGMMDSPDVLFNPDNQMEAAAVVAFTNRRLAEKLGIAPAARCTCVKPSGTASCLLGTSSGIHPHHAKRYFRRVQANKMEPCFQFFASVNPEACEDSVWSANGTDAVMTFCVETPEEAKTKQEIDAVTLLKYVRLTQRHWVRNGKEPRICTKEWLSHNVSNTINVREDEWDEAADFIYDHREDFTAVSILPHTGDKDYPQAPLTAVYDEGELRKMYGEQLAMAHALCGTAPLAFQDVWSACEAASGRADCDDNERQIHWVSIVREWADSHFGGDVRNATHAIKDVDNWERWQFLKANYRTVDYSQLREDEDVTKPMDTVACGNGACELF